MPPVRVVGVIRGSEKPSIFVPANEPNSGQWFYVDVPMIARACGLPENTVYIEDINEDVSPTNPYPVPKDVNTLIRHSVMPDDHLKYTFTWYTFNPKLIANLQLYYIIICQFYFLSVVTSSFTHPDGNYELVITALIWMFVARTAICDFI